MEMVDITIQIETERLTALNFFLFDKQNSSLKTELEKAAEEMYEKYVPEDTRRFIESKTKPTPTAKARPKRHAPKPTVKPNAEKEVPHDEQ